MAKQLKYITDIVTGQPVEAPHISQSVEAFSAESGVQKAYDISVSGSFKVTGSQFIEPNMLLNQQRDYVLAFDNDSGQIFKMSTSSIQDNINEIYKTGSSNTNIIPNKFGTFDNTGVNSVIASGNNNKITSNCSFIGGGTLNTASAQSSFIGGGNRNEIQGTTSQNIIVGGTCNKICTTLNSNNIIVGGSNNLTNNSSNTIGHSTIVGGTLNTATGGYSFIGAGKNNCTTISSTNSVIVAGENNKVSSINSSVVGGTLNTASASCTFIGGGSYNQVSGINSSVVGGTLNTASAQSSFIGGGNRNEIQGTALYSSCYSSIVGGSNNLISSCCSFIGGGSANTVSNCYSSIVGGCNNTLSEYYGFIGGGSGNTVSDYWSSIVGGDGNIVSGDCSGILGGRSNNIYVADGSLIGGGRGNIVSGGCSGVLGGSYNQVSGINSSVVGGFNNTASSEFSAIVGGVCNHIQLTHCKSFIVGTNISSSAACTTFVNNLYITGSTTTNAVMNLSTRCTTPNPLTEGAIWNSGSAGAGCLYFSPNGTAICKLAFV